MYVIKTYKIGKRETIKQIERKFERKYIIRIKYVREINSTTSSLAFS